MNDQPSPQPLLARVPPGSLDLDTLFEFGLSRLLDGVAADVSCSHGGKGRVRGIVNLMRPHGHAMNVLVDGDHAGLKAARRAGWISWSTG